MAAGAVMTSTSPLPDVAGIKALRLAVVSDAAPERNGVGAYYQDLVEYAYNFGYY